MRWVLLIVFTSVWAAERLLDPTEPPSGLLKLEVGEATNTRWVVNSVLVSPRRKVAIINNKLVKPGEFIEGQEVIEIRLEGVVLKTTSGEQIVLLPGRAIKEKVK